jgi:hypothetical protein
MHEALHALREADRFLHVARLTHAREIEEARQERSVGLRIALGAEVPQALLRGPARDDDAVGAVRDVGEAIVAIKRAVAALPEDASTRTSLLACLAARHGGLVPHINALHGATRRAHEELRTDAEPPLPNWTASDAEDAAIAKAAGVELSPLIKVAIVALAALLLLGPKLYDLLF